MALGSSLFCWNNIIKIKITSIEIFVEETNHAVFTASHVVMCSICQHESSPSHRCTFRES